MGNMTKKDILIAVIIVFSLGTGLIAGLVLASVLSFQSEYDSYSARMQRVPACEKKFIESLGVADDSELKSGNYILEVWLPGEAPTKTTLKVPFKDGQFDFPPEKTPSRTGMSNSAKIQYPLVTWSIEGTGYDIGTEYVGVVQGDMMWGRVYNHGEGSPEELGFWKLYPTE